MQAWAFVQFSLLDNPKWTKLDNDWAVASVFNVGLTMILNG